MAIVGSYVIACFAIGLVAASARPRHNAAAFWINTAWSAWILSLAVAALVRTTSTVDFRRTPRAHAELPARWTTEAGSGIGVLVDLSERGAAVPYDRALSDAERSGAAPIEAVPDAPAERAAGDLATWLEKSAVT